MSQEQERQEGQGQGQQWFEDILGPAAPAPTAQKPEAPFSDTTPAQAATPEPKPIPQPYRAPLTDPWKRLLHNVKELYPQYYKAFRIVQQQGVNIIQGQDRFYLGRGLFLSEKDFEILISHLYYHIIGHRTQGTKIHQVFGALREKSVRLKEAGDTGLRLVCSEYVSDEGWEQVKRELLEPNRDDVIKVQRMARDELASILTLSSMAQVIQHNSGVDWDELGK